MLTVLVFLQRRSLFGYAIPDQKSGVAKLLLVQSHGWCARMTELVGAQRMTELGDTLRMTELVGAPRMAELSGAPRMTELGGAPRMTGLGGAPRMTELVRRNCSRTVIRPVDPDSVVSTPHLTSWRVPIGRK